MALDRRTLLVAGGAGLAVAGATVFGGAWFATALDDTPPVDGEFVLDRPGVFEESRDDLNGDVVGDRVPDVTLFDADGAPVRLADDRGRPLVLNLWFSTCPPCERELRDFAEVHAEVGEQIRFVGVDPFDGAEPMIRFATDRGVTYELLRDPEREFTRALEVVAFPVTLFVDADGRVLRQTGELDADRLREIIDELF